MTMRAAILAAAAATVVAVPAAAKTQVVTAARMLDVEKGVLVPEPVVVVTDGRIVSVVTRGGARPVIPAGAERIDLGEATLVPG